MSHVSIDYPRRFYRKKAEKTKIKNKAKRLRQNQIIFAISFQKAKIE